MSTSTQDEPGLSTSTHGESGPRRTPPLSLILPTAAIAICVLGLFTSVSDIASGLWTIGLMLSLMMAGIPIAVSMMVSSTLGIYYVSGGLALTNVLGANTFSTASSWSMTVLPLFIFMGLLLTQSGITQRLYRATELWFGWLPGGLGIGTTAAGAGLASVSGSTIGMTYALGRAGIPEMIRSGYDRRVAVGTVITAGLPGQLIPPSILLVVYAGIAEVPVGPQLIAGFIPGIAIAALYAAALLLIGVIAPRLVGRGHGAKPGHTWLERFRALLGIWGFPVIMLVLFGGMFSGVFTPSEAGAAAAGMALILAIIYTRKDKPLGHVATAATHAVRATGAVFFVLIGAHMLTRMLSVTGLATGVAEFIIGLGLSRVAFLCLLVVIYIIMGMFFDTLAMVLLTVPVLLPTFAEMGINALWFGVFVVLLGEIAMVTPPVGVLSYVVYNLCKRPEVNIGTDISLKDIFTSLLWFLPVALIFLLMLILWPDIALWLPSISRA